MRIARIHIDGFGVWHQAGWSDLSPGVNVFLGANEAGKTTLMGFVRSVLFGFERRTHPGRYEPQRGGRYGGWLEIVDGGRGVRIERRASRHVRGRVRVRFLEEADGSAEEGAANDDEARLDRLLGGTTRTLYHNVFAFGLGELEHFRTLEEGEVASHISGAGMGVGAARWSRVSKDIEERRSRLYLPRGQNAFINRALKELASVEEDLGRMGGQPADYVRAREDRARLESDLQRLGAQGERLAKRIEHLRRLKAAEPHRRQRAEILGQLDRLEVVASFPEGGVAQLNLLLHQRRQLEAELQNEKDDSEGLRRERRDLASDYTPQELIRTGRAVDSVRGLLPRREMVEARLADEEEKGNALREERDRTVARRDAARPPSWAAVLLFLVVVTSGAVGLVLTGHTEGAWALGAPLVLFVYWYFRRWLSWRSMRSDLGSVQDRLRSSEEALTRLLEEGRRLGVEIERHVGRSDFSYTDLEREAARVQALTETAERIRSIDEALAGHDRRADRIRDRVQANEGAVAELLRTGGASSETEFFRRSELFEQRRQLEQKLARIPVIEIEPEPDTAGVEGEGEGETPGPEDLLRLIAESERVAGELAEARTAMGRLDERIAVLGQSEERSRARLRKESILARVDSAAEEWAVLTLCRTLLEDTRRVYETERQPEVLAEASKFFSRMSEGAWVRVVSSLDSSQVLVESRQGDRLSPDRLSRGTAEQLYLAVRMALVREYSSHVKPLPVILDDVFVNFDPARTRRSVQALAELAQTHQVLVFTCHPHLVRIVEEIVHGAQIYPLQ